MTEPQETFAELLTDTGLDIDEAMHYLAIDRRDTIKDFIKGRRPVPLGVMDELMVLRQQVYEVVREEASWTVLMPYLGALKRAWGMIMGDGDVYKA